MDGREFRELLTHMEWADAQTWRAIRDLPAAQTDDRLRWLLHHLHTVHWVYLQAWRGDPFSFTDVKTFPDLAAVAAWAMPYYPLVRGYAATVDDDRLSRPIEFPWAAMIEERYGTVAPATLAESDWQVISHTTYHRGQIATRIRELGGEPPLVDFIVWVWKRKPAPDWAAESAD